MKKYLIATLAIVMAMTACRRTMYNEEVPPQATSTTDAAETGAPAAIELGSNLQANVETKSLGALDDWIKASQKLYIYGISRVQSTTDPASAEADSDLDLSNDGILIKNVLAEFPEGFVNANDQEKQLINVFNPQGQANEPFYYNESKRYEFFGYYVDDAVNNPAPTIGENNITLPITINGAQDIMLATTDKLDDNTADINPNRLYSAYSSRKGIRPNLIFKHQLSRFNVWVKSGDDAALTAKMHIATLSFETETQGTLYIANKAQATTAPYLDVTENTKKFIGIWHGSQGFTADGEEAKRLDSSIEEAANKYTYNPTNSWTKAGTLMVMPGEREYNLKVGLTQDGATAAGEVISNYTINFADLLKPSEDPKGAREDDNYVPDTKAEPGHQYDVNIIVYGLQAIEITVTMSEWEDAGSFVVDQDSDDEVAIATALDNIEDGQPHYGEDGSAAHPLTLEVNDTFALTPTAESEITSITSSKETVATVTAAGVVTAVSSGDAKIIIKAAPILTGEHRRPEGGYRVVNVHVNGAPATPITFTSFPADIDNLVEGGDNFTLNAAVASEQGATITYVVDPSDPAYANVISKVDQTEREFHIVGVGTAKIKVTAHKDGNYTDAVQYVTVTVSAAPATPITINNVPAAFEVTYAQDGTFNVTGSATASVDGATITYSVDDSDASYATIISKSDVAATTFNILKAGTAKITITAHKEGNYTDGTATVTVTVNKAQPAAITVTGAAGNVLTINGMNEDATYDLTGVINRSGDGVITTAIEDGKGAVATLAGNAITVKGNGTAQITVSVAEGTNYQAAADYVFTLSLTNVVVSNP